jgi:phage/plasmid-associated DNA primase
VFQTSFYEKNIEWNKNRDLFVFEDKVYDLKSGGFIQGNPDDYVNMTCGYKYDLLFDNEQLIIARNGILKFVESITGGVDERDYMIKTYSRGLKQLNQCEKAYFIIGSGRNGKGTNSLLNSRALGDYFGTLNMEYYTVHKKSIDEPNQNLYNCRNSRVLSSSETNDEDANGRKVKFIISKFQSLTGNDLINARAIGTQDVAYFHAGVPIIDINFMIDFSKKEIDSIRERIDIQETPFTFTDDDKIINEYPDKYRKVDITLKEKFASDIYRRAMIDLLFEYYGKDVKRPLSVKKRTDAYFADDTLESWINENCIVEGDGEIELSIIQSRSRTDTDKIMTIRAIKEYLTNKKFVVKQKEGINQLRGYAFVKEDEDEEKK